MASRRVAPAFATKHVNPLHHPLAPANDTVSLVQDDEAETTTGSTVWLGAQVLSVYLHHLYGSQPSADGKRAIELGAGTGLASLKLASLGFDVIATDVNDVLDRVLRRNIESNLAAHPRWPGSCRAVALDWTQDVASELLEHLPFSLVISADCVFATSHIDPLLRTVHRLAQPSTIILVALEVRDPALVQSFLAAAAAPPYAFTLAKIPRTKLRKLIVPAYDWREEDWSDVEIWKMKASPPSTE